MDGNAGLGVAQPIYRWGAAALGEPVFFPARIGCQRLAMRTLRQDVLYALRQMRLSPIFTLTAMLTLALGIGATTAIFSLIDTVMLKSLPVADPASLYRVGEGNDCCVQAGPQDNWGLFPYELYQRFAAAAPEFEQLAAFQAGDRNSARGAARTDQHAKPLRGEFVSGNYFATFGVQAYAGRTLTPADDQPSAAPAAMLSHRVWQQEYGSDPKVVGASFMLDGHPFTIVGITPPGFYGETLRSDPPEISSAAAAGTAAAGEEHPAEAAEFLAADHRPSAAGRQDRRTGRPLYHHHAPVAGDGPGSASFRSSCPRSRPCCPSRTSK